MSVYAGPADWWTNDTNDGRTHIATKGIVQSGLILNLDAGVSLSYPGSGNTWTDLTSSGYNGTLFASPTFTSNNGGGIVLNGTTQYGTSTMPNPLAETVTVWARSATANWNEYGWLSSSRGVNGHIIHPWLNTKEVQLYVYDSTGGVAKMVGSVFPSDITIPHMYTYTTNGSNSHKLYLDGDLVFTNTTGTITRTSSPTNVTYYYGKDSTLARYGNGTLHNVLRYNRELTAIEVQQNFNALRGRFGI